MPDTFVTVHSSRQYGQGFPPENLLAFRDWLAVQVKAIPKEYRNEAAISIVANMAYDMPVTEITIDYHRPETPEEAAERKAREAREDAVTQRREREDYERLKAKFG